jgi:hypothetical protein
MGKWYWRSRREITNWILTGWQRGFAASVSSDGFITEVMSRMRWEGRVYWHAADVIVGLHAFENTPLRSWWHSGGPAAVLTHHQRIWASTATSNFE